MSNFKRLMKGHDEEKTTRFDVLVGIRNVDILSDEERVKEVLSDSLKGSVYVNKKVAQAKPENIYCIGPWVRVFALTNEDDFPVFKERVLTIDGVLDVERFGDLWRDAAAKRTFLERGKRFKEYCKKSLKQNMQDFSKHGVAKYVGSYDKQSVQDFLKSVNECEAEINIVFGNENGFENYVIKTKTFPWYRDALSFLEQETQNILVDREDLQIKVPYEVLESSFVEYFGQAEKKKIRFHIHPDEFVDVNLFIREV